MRVGVIGLGRMGAAMAATLARSGHEVRGYDLDPDRVGGIADASFIPAKQLADLALCEALLLSLPNAVAVEAALFGTDTLVARGPRLVIDTSTIDPKEGLAIGERLSATGVAYVDAPVSGGPSGAASGELTIMVGGADDAVAAAQPVLETIGGKVIRCGGAGAGHAVKLINNLLVATNLGGLRVALRLGRAFGLDAERLLLALNAGSGRSAATEMNAPRWITSGRFDSGFSAGLMRKDIGLAAGFATGVGLDEPFVEAVRVLWADPGVGDGDDFNRIADPEAGRGE